MSKKIMFNDLYGLTQAVLDGRKTMTRRIVPQSVVDYYTCEAEDPTMIDAARYQVGEIVAVAQAYRDIDDYNPESYEDVALDCGVITSRSHPYSFLRKSAGWLNKMFVRADLMPIKIRITDVKVEELQDISDEDCLKEGIFGVPTIYTYYGAICKAGWQLHWTTPREAFASLIDKISGKGTWEKNPFCFCYEFEIVK